MKVKSDFVLRNVAGSFIVVPTGAACMDFNGMITLNETGAFIWKCLQSETTVEQIAEDILKEYDISKADAIAAVKTFVNKLKEEGCLE